MQKLDKEYKKVINKILTTGTESSDRTGTGTIKIFGNEFRHKMSNGFPLLTTKKMFWKGILRELLWFLKGSTNIKELVDNNVNIWIGDCLKKFNNNIDNKNNKFSIENPNIDYLPKARWTIQEFTEKIKNNQEFAEKWGNLGKVYGAQWINWNNEINQIQEIMDTLITNPDSRRMIVTAWNPSDIKNVILPPCHYSFQVVTRELTFEEKIQWVMNNTETDMENVAITEEVFKSTTPKRAISLLFNMRSVDWGLGFPFDIASYGMLLTMIAQCVNMIPDELICMSGDTHIYTNQINGLKEQLKNKPYKLPKIYLNENIKNIFDFKFEDIKIENYKSHDKIILPLSN